MYTRTELQFSVNTGPIFYASVISFSRIGNVELQVLHVGQDLSNTTLELQKKL